VKDHGRCKGAAGASASYIAGSSVEKTAIKVIAPAILSRKQSGENMPHPIRRADRALSSEATLQILKKGEYGTLSTVSPDGQPYGVPVSFAYAGNALYFHCAVEGHKLENLAANPRVSFCVVGATEVLPGQFATCYESAVAFGAACELSGDAKRTALKELLKKYSPDFLEKGEKYIASDIEKTKVFMIEIEALSGKARR
jgi:uncharacterized protein